MRNLFFTDLKKYHLEFVEELFFLLGPPKTQPKPQAPLCDMQFESEVNSEVYFDFWKVLGSGNSSAEKGWWKWTDNSIIYKLTNFSTNVTIKLYQNSAFTVLLVQQMNMTDQYQRQ